MRPRIEVHGGGMTPSWFHFASLHSFLLRPCLLFFPFRLRFRFARPFPLRHSLPRPPSSAGGVYSAPLLEEARGAPAASFPVQPLFHARAQLA
jgi:hypothetical protein